MENLTLKNIITRFKIIALLFAVLLFQNCSIEEDVINIGYIGPLSKRATDLGVAPSKAIKLAVEQYNANKKSYEPRINVYLEDDQWDKKNALPAYKRLRAEHNVKVVFISNSDGTIAISQQAKKDRVIVVNPTNNDAILDKLNNNIFKIAKRTEETHSIIAYRIIDLGLKKVLIMHYPNDFMTLGANTCKDILTKNGIETKVVSFKKEKKDFREELKTYKKEGYDALVFFGYKEYGYAMKQARDLNINAKFFGSTVLLAEGYYENSEGAIKGTECLFFTPENGNLLLAEDFFKAYKEKYKETPFSVWPPMQAYDASNIVINQLKTYTSSGKEIENFDDWLREKLLNVRYYEGVCGNISINPNGSSSGIYFSLYEYTSKGVVVLK